MRYFGGPGNPARTWCKRSGNCQTRGELTNCHDISSRVWNTDRVKKTQTGLPRVMGRVCALLVAASVCAAGCAPGRAPDRPIWVGDYETGTLSQFADPQQEDFDPSAPQVEGSVVANGHYAGAYRIPPGGRECESVPLSNELQQLTDGDDLWFAWYMRLSPGFPTNSTKYQNLVQWKNSGLGTPPLMMTVRTGTDRFAAEGGFSHPDGNRASSADLGPVVTGQWIAWTWHIVFSTDPHKAEVSVWRDGKQIADGWRPLGGTLYPARAADGSNPNSSDGPFSTWELGYQRDPSIQVDATVYLDSIVAGMTQASVQLPPLAKSP